MSFHTGQSFTFGETPSATKWNYLWENDYALADGTGLEDDIIDSRHYVDGSIDPAHHANRTRRVRMQLQADNAGGAVTDQNEAPAVAFTGTPTGYARAVCLVPEDYVEGTDITIKILHRASATNSSEDTQHFIACRSSGDVHSSWNIASSVAQNGINFSTTWGLLTLSSNIPAASVDAGDYVGAAWGVRTALSGTVYCAAIIMEYTSNS